MSDTPSASAAPLLITVSFNSPDYEASDYFTARAAWAKANGFEHLYVSERTTGLRLDAHCSSWLRLPMMQALRGRAIFYLDNDCMIAPDCPHPALIMGGLDGVFLARGHSGRPNSGVQLVSPAGSEIFAFCIDRIGEEPPAECAAPYENGHVIWACTVLPWRPLPGWMNDTRTQDGKVIHHTGPNLPLRRIDYRTDLDTPYDRSKATVNNPAALRAMGSAVLHALGIEGRPS